MNTTHENKPMGLQNAELRAYEEKINAELKDAKAKLEAFQAHVKGKNAEAEIQTINALKAARQHIEKKRDELKTAGEAKLTQIKADVDAELAKLKSLAEQLAAKMKGHAATTA